MQTIWQLARWENFDSVCMIVLGEDRSPTNDEIRKKCGEDILQMWLSTPVCEKNYANQDDPNAVCKGLFLWRVGQQEKADDGTDTLPDDPEIPEARFRVKQENCENGTICGEKPIIQIEVQNVDEGVYFNSIRIRVQTFEGVCEGTSCRLQLPSTTAQGEWLEFWAMTPDGYQSNHFWLKFRIIDRFMDASHQYQYDAVGQFLEGRVPYGTDLWYVFPQRDLPMADVLQRVPTADFLVTAKKYSILSANLIQNGKVDGSVCIHYGLNEDGTANGCGEDITGEKVYEYQNQFNDQLFKAGEKYDVPPRVVKGLIAQESQFWPFSSTPYEYGLGMMTESGADMLLRWNNSYFLKICTDAFKMNSTKCYGGFSNMKEEDQILLRGAAIAKIGTDEEIELLTATIRAAMTQIGQLVVNVTGKLISDVTTYEDMWKFSIADYYSGSGCLYNAMVQVNMLQMPLTWENVQKYMYGKCEKAGQYVDRVFSLGY